MYRNLVLPLLIIVVGVGWLLTTLGFLPEIDWLWTLGLAAIGIVTFLVGGWNKFTMVVGPFFLIASLLSVIRQTGRLNLNVEVPILVITLGVLLLIVQSPGIPTPSWLIQVPHDRD